MGFRVAREVLKLYNIGTETNHVIMVETNL